MAGRTTVINGKIIATPVDPDGSKCVGCGCECYLEMLSVKLDVIAGGKNVGIVETNHVLCGSCAEVIERYDYEVSEF